MSKSKSKQEDATALEIRKAREELWRQGVLEWKLHPSQKDMYDFFHGKKDKTIIFNCSRRLGKTFLLLLMALETCIKKKSIVKFILPEQGWARKLIYREVMPQLLIDCPKELIPTFKTQDNVYEFANGSQIQLAGTDNGNYEKLRGGNCLAQDTLIMTPSGPKKIQDIQVGEYVYGVNKDNSVSLTKILAVHNNGVKKVTDIFLKNQYVGACTDEHRWQTNSLSSLMRDNPKYSEKSFGLISDKNDRIVRHLIDIPCGNVNEEHAYLIGAFIGDGCSTAKRGNSLTIAAHSEDPAVPNNCAKLLNCFVKPNLPSNSYNLTTTNIKGKHSEKMSFNYYHEWIKGKGCYDKNFDWDVVNTWNRESCVALVAGLVDTDGSVCYTPNENALELSYSSNNLFLIKNIQKLLFKMYQFEGSIKVRTQEGLNDQYTLRIRNSFFVKTILKEISPKLACERKRYQTWMDDQKSRDTGKYSKITKGEAYYTNTYDLSVDNETHLYLTAHGLVTHNSDLCLIDEAGFCSDLVHIISSILIPTTMLTKGRIILSSTTPDNPNHEFITQMALAGSEKRLIVKTLYDGLEDSKRYGVPHITPAIIEDIIIGTPGGAESDAFRTEYLCQVITDSDKSVIPEFARAEEDIVVPWVMPAFCDKYVSMDIGFKDLTVALFAYYDFENAVLVVQDEWVLKGEELTTQRINDSIRKKESDNWTNKITGEQDKPYRRVSDNNLIVINDLARLHNLFFVPTEKQNKAEAINALRMMIDARQIRINPNCTTLINHLKLATWAPNKRDYARSGGHHFDACFTEDAEVLTSAGYKFIKDIQVGELVLTHENRFKKVLSTMKKDYSGDLLEIKPAGRSKITCTPEHTFYTAEKYKNQTDGFTGQTFLTDPTWIAAKDLSENNLLYIPNIPSETKLDVCNELCFLYGYYVAEGSLGGNGYQINFAGHKKEANVSDILRQAIEKSYTFNSKTGTSENSIYRHKYGITKPRSSDIRTYNKGGNSRTICLSNQELYNELKKLGKSTEKHFPDWIVDLNEEQALYMLSGYLFGDGHCAKTGIKVNTISKRIKDGTDILGRKLGIIFNVCKQKKITHDQFWSSLDLEQTIKLLDLIEDQEDLKYCFQDKLIHSVELKNKRHYPKNFKSFSKDVKSNQTCSVYNLEVEDDNSYTVNGVAVHNCDALVYLVRNLDMSHNPFPKGYRYQGLTNNNAFFREESTPDPSGFLGKLSEQFKSKSTLRRSTDRSETNKQAVDILNKQKKQRN